MPVAIQRGHAEQFLECPGEVRQSCQCALDEFTFSAYVAALILQQAVYSNLYEMLKGAQANKP